MRTWLQNGGLLLGTCLALVGIGELAVRALSPFPSWEHEKSCAFPDRHDARLGWSGVPHLDQRFAQREFSIRIETNGDGFRDEEFAAKRERSARRGSRRVVLLGDSFVWGFGVAAAERVGEQLELLAGDWTTFNLAQCGYGTDQEYLTYLAHGEAIDADLVLLFFFANDLGDVNAEVRYEGQAKPRYTLRGDGLALVNVPVPYDARHWERKRMLAGRRGDCPPPDAAGGAGTAAPGALAQLGGWSTRLQLANWLRFRAEQLRSESPAPRPDPRRLAAQARVALALVDALAERVTRGGARFGLVLVPEKRQVLDGESAGAWQQILLAHCARAGLACLDLLPSQSGRAEGYFRSDPHWNASGHRLAAARVLAFARSQGLVSSPPRPGASAARTPYLRAPTSTRASHR